MKFSILIPAYNSERYIKRCIDSINNQTYQNYEVIIINDGSTDNTLEMINNNISDKYKVISRENKGVSITRNELVKNASGDYFIFVDSDDYINDKLLEILNNYLINNDVDIVRYDSNSIDLEGNYNYKYISKEFSILDGYNYIKYYYNNKKIIGPLFLYAYKNKFFKKHKFKFFEGKLHEDFYNIYVLASANAIGYINYVGYNYIKRENSITYKKSQEDEIKRTKDILFVFDNTMSLIEKLDNIDENKLNEIYKFEINFLDIGLKNLDDSNKEKYIKEINKRKK